MSAAQPPWAAAYGPGVPLHLEHDDSTLVDRFERSARLHPDRVALDFLGATTTYARFADRVARVAEGLRRLGVGPGDSVALVMPNCPQNVIAFYAVLRLGATAVEHNPLYTAGELHLPFIDHGARVAVVWDKVVPVVEQLRAGSSLEHVVAVDLTAELPLAKRLALRLPLAKARAARAQLSTPAPGALAWRGLVTSPPLDPDHPRPSADDVALLLYTSGTTGEPKGVPLRHRNLVANVVQGRAWVPGLVEGEETFLLALPLFHAYGVTVGMLLGVDLAATLVLLPKPEIGLLMEAIERRLPSFVPAVPPLYDRIATEAQRRGTSVAGIRYALSGAMPLPAELVARWEAATGGLLVEGYGLTETSPVVVGNPMTTDRRPGSIGVPFPDVEVRIADADDLDRAVPLGERGELLVRGPQVFERLPGPAGGHGGGLPRRVVPHRRRRDDGCRRVHHDRRPDQGGHHHRWLQRLPLRGRGGAAGARRHPRRRRRRHPAPERQRGGRRGRGGRRRRRARPRGAARPRPGDAHRLQGAAAVRRRRGAAGQRDGQGAASRGGHGPATSLR